MNEMLKVIAEKCLLAARKEGEVDLCEMWRGRAIVFFSAIADLSESVELEDDPTILWNLKKLSTFHTEYDQVRDYLINLPGFTFDAPVPVQSFSQHLALISKFDEEILSVFQDYPLTP